MIIKTRTYSLFIVIFPILFLTVQYAYAERTAVVIKSQNLSAYNKTIKGFENECIKKNINIKSVYDMKGKRKLGFKLLREIKKQEPVIILTIGVLATTIAKEEIRDIPIIFCMVINHERFKLAGLNITGIATEIAIEKQLKGYQTLLDSLQNIGVIYDPSKTGNIVKDAESKTKDAGLNLIKYEIKSSKKVSKALDNMVGKIDALWILPDSTVINKKSFRLIKNITQENNIPLLCTSDVFVKAGALMAVFSDYEDIGRQASQLAEELLSISTASSLGIIPPDKFKVAINSNTAEKLGIKLEIIQQEPYVIIYQ